MAVSGGRGFVGANDPSFPGQKAKPGVCALDVDNGDLTLAI